MALLDPRRRCIVVRVVYDGPAYAGKTTNLRALARSLGSKVFSGDEEDGRTLFFDWVEYVGGIFEGMPIRCQVVGVPGQRVLERRRRLLLETADVVVFVADSVPERLAENARAFELLRQVVAPMVPPVAVVAQANKRDISTAISLEALRDALGGGRSLAVTEAVAELGEGVRETFVLAVRLALDRVRELWDKKALPEAEPEIDDGAELLDAMLAAEGGEAPGIVRLGLGGIDRRSVANVAGPPPESESTRPGEPRLPDPSVPPGLVWPPIEGRVAVHESARVATRIERQEGRDWIGGSRDWKLRAPSAGLFSDLEEGREALLAWARWHKAVGKRLSGPRSLVLVPEAAGTWRLWQIVGRVRTLHDACLELLTRSDDKLLGRGLLEVIDLRLKADAVLVATGVVGRLDLASVAASKASQPVFAGFAPFPAGAKPSPAAKLIDEDRLIRAELGPLLRKELALAPRRIPVVLASLHLAAEAKSRHNVAESIKRILLAS